MVESKIEWTDRSDWNPIRGCTRISPGCGGPGPHGGCYAEAIAARFSGEGQPFEGFAERTAKGPRWTGKVELIEDRLTLPLRWRKPARVFASSTSDIFHESLPDAAIDRIFAVMAMAPHLTFQVLTKRSARMRDWFGDASHGTSPRIGHILDQMDDIQSRGSSGYSEWPLPNVWLGVSVEDQTRADERIPDLLETPAAIRFVSAEPLLGPVRLDQIKIVDRQTPEGGREAGWESALSGKRFDPWSDGDTEGWPKLDWVIIGGESGPNARPMHPDWVRGLRDQCAAAGVPFFFKQWGFCLPGNMDGEDEHGRAAYEIEDAAQPVDYDRLGRGRLIQAHGCDFIRFGHKRTGRLLDGREWNEVPA